MKIKKSIPALVTVILAVTVVLVLTRGDKNPEMVAFAEPQEGVAVIITGAAARIPQEAALLEEMDKRGLLKDLVFISGVSSGAINAVMLNGILSGRMTWDEYRSLLFNLKTSDVYVHDGHSFPVNTSPARELYRRVFEDSLGFHSIGDLPYHTSISITHLNGLPLKDDVYRMCSQKINAETDTSLSIVDVVMASSAFPVAFPPVRIKNVKTIPDVEYIDGAASEDMVPYRALLEFEEFRGAGVEKIYIVSRKSDSMPQVSEELRGLGINDKGLFDKLGISLDAIIDKGILKRLNAYVEEAPDHVPVTYVWVPDFTKDFLLFNFDNLEEQYELTSGWAKTHEPVPLGDYLINHHGPGEQ
jgi:predicted acylesterase/phospholipase RssA